MFGKAGNLFNRVVSDVKDFTLPPGKGVLTKQELKTIQDATHCM
jgi:hypothetical protein